MPAITATKLQGVGAKTLTETILDGTDSFTYKKGYGQILLLRNPTAGAITPTLLGDAAATTPADNATPKDVSGGYTPSAIAASAAVEIELDKISAFLADSANTPDITSGTGLVAALLEK